MKFYDRENEMTALKKYEKLSNKNAQFIVITGRRRIGKTTLIKRAFTEIQSYHKKWNTQFVGLTLDEM